MNVKTATIWLTIAITAAMASPGSSAVAAPPATGPAEAVPATPDDLARLLPDAESPQGAASMIQWIVVVTVLSLAPAILVMVTSFTRIIVVLSLLRQAIAAPNVPPNQVLFGLALLMTVAVMAPVWQGVYNDAVAPLMDGRLERDEALAAGESHVRGFMIRQIEAGGNTDDVYLFLPAKMARPGRELKWADVPTVALIPAFAVSELKVAFYMGFRVLLPFLIVDILVGAVLVSMGMLMLPPVMVSLPFKLLLFVLADGWRLVVGTLMASFG